METRTIIGEFAPRSILANDGIAFPLVRAWIDQAGHVVPSNLKQAFPDRGTVFLGINTCNGLWPNEFQFGYFSCQWTNAGDAQWSVSHVESTLGEVVKAPAQVTSFAGFYEWLKHALAAPRADIFGGNGSIYVELGFCGLVVGPFKRGAQGLVPCPTGVFYCSGNDVPVWGVSGDGPFFVDSVRFPLAHHFPGDAAGMVRKVCGLLNAQLGQLTERKLKSFAEAVVDLHGVQFIPGALQEVAGLLDAAGARLSGGHDQSLVTALLGNKLISDALQARWLQDHKSNEDQVSALRVEVETLTTRKRSLENDLKGVEAEFSRRSAEIGSLTEEEARAKLAARDAFEKELAVLASEPAKVAVLSSVFSRFGAAPVPDSKVTAFNRQELAAGKWTDLGTQLARIGVAVTSRKELAIVGQAAFTCGQPVWIRSSFSDLLAKALLSCRGHSQILAVDVPAGLLEPLPFPSQSELKALLFQNANRSDISLVWAGVHEAILRQMIQPDVQMRDIVLTLESNEFLSVKQEMPFGPVVDDRYLSFGLPKELGEAPQDTESPNEAPTVVDGAEFENELGPTVAALEPLKLSSFRMTCLLAFSALRTASKEGSGDAKRLLFKYWLLPRLEVADAYKALQENATEWATDPVLKVLSGKATLDGSE